MSEEVTGSAYQKPRPRKWHSRVHLHTGSNMIILCSERHDLIQTCTDNLYSPYPDLHREHVFTLSRPAQRACISPYPDLHREPVFTFCRPAQTASTYHSQIWSEPSVTLARPAREPSLILARRAQRAVTHLSQTCPASHHLPLPDLSLTLARPADPLTVTRKTMSQMARIASTRYHTSWLLAPMWSDLCRNSWLKQSVTRRYLELDTQNAAEFEHEYHLMNGQHISKHVSYRL